MSWPNFCQFGGYCEIQGYGGLMRHGMFETSGQRWMDKFNIFCNKDNKLSLHADHTPLDGIAVVSMISYFEAHLQKLKNCSREEILGDSKYFKYFCLAG